MTPGTVSSRPVLLGGLCLPPARRLRHLAVPGALWSGTDQMPWVHDNAAGVGAPAGLAIRPHAIAAAAAGGQQQKQQQQQRQQRYRRGQWLVQFGKSALCLK